MKNIFKNMAVLFSAALVMNACDTVDFGDTNVDPNKPTQAVTSQLLTHALKYIGGTENASSEVFGVLNDETGSLYTQQITEGQYPGESRYTGNQYSYNSWYVGPLMNLREIISVNEDPAQAVSNSDNQIAVAKLVRAYLLSYMTDIWGYLPYSEAFQGIDGTKPKFDSQEDIYDVVFGDINDALGRIDTNQDGPDGDVMFGGDMDKWLRFGNTMKMVLALRISDANATLAQGQFETAVASGHVISSNSENLTFNYGTTEESDNPWEDRFESREDYIMSRTMVEALRTELDPRLFEFAQPARDSIFGSPNFPGNIDEGYVGAPNGKVNGNVPDYSFIAARIIAEKEYNAPIYTFAQVKLSLAEAAGKGWNVGGGSASTHYEEGIQASMDYWGVDAADATAYIAAHPYVDINTIAYEKWVALFMQSHEAWAEWRRLDAPALTPSTYATDQRIPVRHAYSSSVADNNSENYDVMISQQGPDTNHTKLWWDRN